jgi:hypothetical protein
MESGARRLVVLVRGSEVGRGASRCVVVGGAGGAVLGWLAGEDGAATPPAGAGRCLGRLELGACARRRSVHAVLSSGISCGAVLLVFGEGRVSTARADLAALVDQSGPRSAAGEPTWHGLARAYGLLDRVPSAAARQLEAGLALLTEPEECGGGSELGEAEAEGPEAGWAPGLALGDVLAALGDVAVPSWLSALAALVTLSYASDGPAAAVAAAPVRMREVSAVAALAHARGLQLRELYAGGSPAEPARGQRRRRRRHLRCALALDCALGLLLGLALALHGRAAGDALYDTVGRSLQSEVMEARVRWILSQHAPLGVKLNRGLDDVLGGCVLLVVRSWHAITAAVAPAAPRLIAALGGAAALGGGGASLVLAVAADAARALTLHVRFLHALFARVHRFQAAGLRTSLLVARGSKRNVLRRRTDTGDYDTAQLLLGSVATVVFAFLLQTALAYYAMFLALWTLVVIGHGVLLTAMRLLHRAPVASLLSLRRSGMEPDGALLRLPGPDELWDAPVLHGNYVRPAAVLGAWLQLAALEWRHAFAGATDGPLADVVLWGAPLRLASLPTATHT